MDSLSNAGKRWMVMPCALGMYIYVVICGISTAAGVSLPTGEPAAFLDGGSSFVSASLPPLGGAMTIEMWAFATSVDEDFSLASFGAEF